MPRSHRPPVAASVLLPLAVLLSVSVALVSTALAETPQPIRFSHKVHVIDNRIDCLFCHASATRSAYAGIPSVEKCMTCHRVVATGNPEVKKLADYWKEKKSIPWNRVTELPDHVYFPHFRMVGAGVPCLTCHPGMDKTAGAVQRRAFTMGFCMDCHRKRGVSIDCWTCHV